MQKLALNDVRDIAAYEKVRPEFRERIIALKKVRRVPVGPHVSMVFENRDTMLFQVQEMMRAERIVHDDRIQEELDVYNALLPEAGELSATFFIEFEDQAQLERELKRFIGVDEKAYFEIRGERVWGESEPGRSTAEKTATVHYVRFRFTPDQQAAFRRGDPIKLGVDHPNYRAETTLSPEVQRSLAADFD